MTRKKPWGVYNRVLAAGNPKGLCYESLQPVYYRLKCTSHPQFAKTENSNKLHENTLISPLKQYNAGRHEFPSPSMPKHLECTRGQKKNSSA